MLATGSWTPWSALNRAILTDRLRRPQIAKTLGRRAQGSSIDGQSVIIPLPGTLPLNR